jgi:hypothetical protein
MQKARTISPFLERENDDVYNIFIITRRRMLATTAAAGALLCGGSRGVQTTPQIDLKRISARAL